MLYAILCYNSEDIVGSWTKEEDDAVMARLAVVQEKLGREGRLGPVARLLPTTAATTVRKGSEPLVIDGPFAETKEQLLGFYIVECASLEEAIETASELARASSPAGAYEIRPIRSVPAGERRDVSDLAWIDAALTSARPQAIGALLRYFRDLDTAEEAFQDACLRALKNWPRNGPPRDPAAWLILVGRNAAIDEVRRRKQAGAAAAGRADLRPRRCRGERWPSGSTARTTATTSCGCCSSAAIPICRRPSRSRWRCASSPACRSSRSRAPSWSARAPWSSASPAPKRRVAGADVPFETPGAVERAERLAAVAAMIYLIFNEGYSASGGEARHRAPLCEEAIRLARLLLRLFPDEPEIMGLTALLLLQHARAPARFDADGAIVLLEDQDRGLWNRAMIAEGLALIDKAMRHRRPGPYQVQAAIAALHAQGGAARRTPTGRRSICSTPRSRRLQPSPVVTLNRAVAVSKVRGPAAALAMIEPLAQRFPAISTSSASRERCSCSSAAPRRPASPSTGRSRSPIRRRRPPISGCIWTG